MKLYTSIAIGVFVGLLIACSIFLTTIWTIPSLIIGLICGLEIGYYSFDKVKYKETHGKILHHLHQTIPSFVVNILKSFIPDEKEKKSLKILFLLMLFFVLIMIYVYNSIIGATWFGDKIIPHASEFSSNSLLFYSYYQAGSWQDFVTRHIYAGYSGMLYFAFGIFFLAVLFGLATSSTNPEIDVLVKLKHANISVGIMAMLAPLVNILLAIIFIICLAGIFLYTLYLTLESLIYLAIAICEFNTGHKELVLTTSIVLGVISGFVYSISTQLTFMSSISTTLIGIATGWTFAFTTIQMGKLTIKMDLKNTYFKDFMIKF